MYRPLPVGDDIEADEEAGIQAYAPMPDVVGLVSVASAARRYRELYELAAGNDELDEAWSDLCDALDAVPVD